MAQVHPGAQIGPWHHHHNQNNTTSNNNNNNITLVSTGRWGVASSSFILIFPLLTIFYSLSLPFLGRFSPRHNTITHIILLVRVWQGEMLLPVSLTPDVYFLFPRTSSYGFSPSSLCFILFTLEAYSYSLFPHLLISFIFFFEHLSWFSLFLPFSHIFYSLSLFPHLNIFHLVLRSFSLTYSFLSHNLHFCLSSPFFLFWISINFFYLFFLSHFHSLSAYLLHSLVTFPSVKIFSLLFSPSSVSYFYPYLLIVFLMYLKPSLSSCTSFTPPSTLYLITSSLLPLSLFSPSSSFPIFTPLYLLLYSRTAWTNKH